MSYVRGLWGGVGEGVSVDWSKRVIRLSVDLPVNLSACLSVYLSV